MTWKISNTPIDPDPYYGAVSLLLHGDGTDGSTNIIDTSLSPKTVTAFGNAQISTAQSKFGGASLRFTVDSTDHLSIPASDSLQVGAGDFTVESWVYLLGNRTFNYIVSKGGESTREWGLAVGPSNIDFYWSTNGLFTGDSLVSRSATLPLNEWMHIAVVKSGTTIKIFKDGVQQGSDGAFTSIFSGNGTFWVGRFMDFGQISHSLNGHLDDLRITKGVARYTSNFTPPSRPFYDFIRPEQDPYFYATSLLLHGDGTNGSTTITDSSPSPKTVTAVGNAQISTAQSKFGGSSIAFDGTGDYLSLPLSDPFNFGSGDFTIETWLYTTTTRQQHIYEGRTFSGAGVLVYLSPTNQLSFYSDGAVRITGNIVSTGSWHHVAFCKFGSLSRLFLNGTQTGSTFNDALTYNVNATTLFIGQNGVNGSYLNGYIDDLRITKGVARYTSNFTPPTRAFPNF